MANLKAANVIIVDTTAQFDGVHLIKSVKYIGNTSGTATIKADSTSGVVIWEQDGTADVLDSDLCIKANHGIYVTITNGAKIYIYLE
jgi:hypothetical protein